MGIPRKQIIQDKALTHVTFRAHNREFYFQDSFIKDSILKIIKKYKLTYGIKIFDWVLLSNHAHFTIFTPNAKVLGDFMRASNKAIANLVNKVFRKSGQAIQDRYKSPVIEDIQYAVKVIGYIWLNPVRAGMIDIRHAQDYLYGSLYYKFRNIKDPLSDSYEELEDLSQFDVLKNRTTIRFIKDYLNELKSKLLSELATYCAEIFEHTHSVGSDTFIKARSLKIKESREDPPL